MINIFNKKTGFCIFLFSVILIVSSCKTIFSKKESENIRVYHVVFLNEVVNDKLNHTFVRENTRYVGKMYVNKATDEVKYYFLKRSDEKIISIILDNFYTNKYEIEYIGYSKEELEEYKKYPFNGKIKHNYLWRVIDYTPERLLTSSQTYKSFGVLSSLDNLERLHYRIIDSEVGEKYYKAKKDAKGEEALINAVKLNEGEQFISYPSHREPIVKFKKKKRKKNTFPEIFYEYPAPTK
ncbi:hypothetical protein Dip518_000059 [Parelusimicrobium proximum]|uniref:hypothetical protein n=1 Tax=Parelusimicrobium proximum TaxID=3228953 RepID=UPI003D173AA5